MMNPLVISTPTAVPGEPDGCGSETYFAVVVTGTASYRGWSAVYVGMGSMLFRHVDGSEFRVDGPPSPQDGCDRWMHLCWDEARRIIAERAEGPAAVRPAPKPSAKRVGKKRGG